MAYQVIARKYRPQRFADVVGQEHVTQTLGNAIQQKRIAHAYLFCGPRGTGKTTVARIFAKCLNCTDGPSVDFDEADSRCVEITEGRSIDVLEIDGASNNGVEQVRELRETVKYSPASSRFKIYIIDEVHMLSTAAFNALLKTLEEPPAHVKFMFATTDPEKVLPTIQSRCQRFDLRRIPVSLITRHLEFIAKQEGVTIDGEALHAIARGADGGMRDAESALDQLISFCGTQIAEADVLSMFGLTARSQVVALAKAVLDGEAARALRELHALAQHGKDLGRLLSDLLGHFRNLLLFQVSGGDISLLEATEAEIASLREQAVGVESDTLTRLLEVLTDAEGRLRDAASRKIFVEVSLLKAIQARKAVSIDSVISRLQQLKEGPPSGRTSGGLPRGSDGAAPAVAPPPAAAPSATKAAPAPPLSPQAVSSPGPKAVSTAAVAAPATEPVSVDLVNVWSELLDAVGRASPFTRGYLIEAHPISMKKQVLTVGYDPEFADQLALVDNAKTHAILQTKLGEAGYPGVQVKFISAERPVGWTAGQPSCAGGDLAAGAPARVVPAAPPAPQPRPAASSAGGMAGTVGGMGAGGAGGTVKKEKEKSGGPAAPGAVTIEEFKNDPLIKKALEIFKGQIVEVRA